MIQNSSSFLPDSFYLLEMLSLHIFTKIRNSSDFVNFCKWNL